MLSVDTSAGAEGPTALFELDPTTLAFEPGGLPDAKEFALSLHGSPARGQCDLSLTPLPNPDPDAWDMQLTPGKPTEEADGRRWLVTTKVARMPQSSGQFQRRFVAKCGAVEQYLRLNIDNSGGVPFSWKVTGLDVGTWNGTSAVPFQVTVGPRPASDVRVIARNVRTPTRPMDQRFAVCATDEPCKEGSVDLTPNSVHELWLVPVPKGEAGVLPGDYSGAMTFTAAENTGGTEVTTRFQVTSTLRRWLGVGLIFCGLAIAFLLGQVLTGQASRLAMLQPAARLRDERDQLARRVSALKQDLATRIDPIKRLAERLGNIGTALDEVALELEPANLRKFLPSPIQVLPPSQNVPSAGESYQDFLNRLGTRIGSLRLLFESGVMPAVGELHQDMKETQIKIIEDTVSSLDALATSPISLEACAAAIQTKLQAMHGSLLEADNLSDDDVKTELPGYSSEAIAFRSIAIQLGAWLLFAVLALIIGTLVLIVRNPSFGTTEDLLYCLLWGVGLPASAQGLAGQTGVSTATALGVRITRPV